jgi:hypothetical protein
MTQAQFDAVLAECRRLAALGDPDLIAADLEARGIRGWRGDTANCPLALHLQEVAGVSTVYVGCGVVYCVDTSPIEELVELVDEFRSLRTFVSFMDTFRYPALDQARPAVV